MRSSRALFSSYLLACIFAGVTLNLHCGGGQTVDPPDDAGADSPAESSVDAWCGGGGFCYVGDDVTVCHSLDSTDGYVRYSPWCCCGPADECEQDAGACVPFPAMGGVAAYCCRVT